MSGYALVKHSRTSIGSVPCFNAKIRESVNNVPCFTNSISFGIKLSMIEFLLLDSEKFEEGDDVVVFV